MAWLLCLWLHAGGFVALHGVTAQPAAAQDGDDSDSEQPKKKAKKKKKKRKDGAERSARRKRTREPEPAPEPEEPAPEPVPEPEPIVAEPFVPNVIVAPTGPRHDSAPERKHKAGTRLLLGASGSGFMLLSGPMATGFDGKLELGLRFGAWRRSLGLSLTPTVLALQARDKPSGPSGLAGVDTSGPGTASAFGFGLGLLSSINIDLGPGLFRIAAGPSLHALSTVVRDAEGKHENRTITLGADAGIGYLFRSAIGHLGLMLEGRLIPFRYDNAAYSPVLIGARLAYLGEL